MQLVDMSGSGLKLKHRMRKTCARGRGGNYNGNSGTSNGKHVPHPDVFAFRRNGYRCEAKWNPKQS
jgi:hypothetical protein